jgi:hypothetical protein
MNEFINGWKWDIYHVGAMLFFSIIIWRVIALAIESHDINKKKVDGRTKKR